MSSKKRKEKIISALEKLGGSATTRQIAKECEMNVNGVAQSLGYHIDEVECLGGTAGDCLWQLKDTESFLTEKDLRDELL